VFREEAGKTAITATDDRRGAHYGKRLRTSLRMKFPTRLPRLRRKRSAPAG
jgi:hypothetical protein